MMRKRVLLLTQWFDPEPTFKGLLFAKELVNRGFDVEVVTGFPNYPGGQVYDGYKIQWLKREKIDGVEVTRVPLYPSHNSSAIKRIFNYVSFALTSLLYCLFFAKKADVMYAYHPPLTIGVVAVITRFFRRSPVVYDIQDMWPDTLESTGMLSNKRALSFIGRVAQWVYKRVDQIVVLSPGFKKLLIERGVDQSKIEVIPNWCDESALNSASVIDHDKYSTENRLKVVFAGNMGKAQALDVVLDAAETLQSAKIDVVFYMIGGGLDMERLKSNAITRGLDNIVFIPQVPMSEIGSYLKQADVLLVHLKKDPLFGITIPSKTQAYLSIGKPVLMGVEGDAADIVRNANAGIVFEPENAQDLFAAIYSIGQLSQSELKQLGENAKAYYLTQLSLQRGVDAFTKIFNELKIK